MIDEEDVDFNGAKLALFLDDSLLVYQRDQRNDIPYAGLLDLPGGGREHRESPQACVLRELREEFGLVLLPERLTLTRCYTIPFNGLRGCLFTATLSHAERDLIRFGEEGQWWSFMSVTTFLAHPAGIQHLQQLVADAWVDKRKWLAK